MVPPRAAPAIPPMTAPLAALRWPLLLPMMAPARAPTAAPPTAPCWVLGPTPTQPVRNVATQSTPRTEREGFIVLTETVISCG